MGVSLAQQLAPGAASFMLGIPTCHVMLGSTIGTQIKYYSVPYRITLGYSELHARSDARPSFHEQYVSDDSNDGQYTPVVGTSKLNV